MKQKKKFKLLTTTIMMILMSFSMIAMSSPMKASAGTGTFLLIDKAETMYSRTYSNGYKEIAMSINSTMYYTNGSWLVKRGGDRTGIRMVQAALNRTMKSNLDIDGLWGPKTESALKSFQATYIGKSSADGICGPQTWATFIQRVNYLNNTENLKKY